MTDPKDKYREPLDMTPNHHKALTQQQVTTINSLKNKEAIILEMINTQDIPLNERWRAIAKTHIEQGIMAAIKAICDHDCQVSKNKN